jgi:hypothetical protein
MRRLKSVSLFFLVVLVVLGCQQPGGHDTKITITYLGWYYENIDTSFWTTPPSNGTTSFYDFFIHYDGDIGYGDIKSANVIAPDGNWWNVCPDSSFFYPQYKVIGGFGRWWDGSAALDLLPIGDFQVEVTLTNGSISRYTGRIPAPGSTTTGPYAWMHSQDAPSPPGNSAAMPVRATVPAGSTLTQSSQTISISFTVNDAKVYNGFVWFYDSSRNYLGEYSYFRDPATGAINAPLGTLNVAGGTNTLTLQAANLTYASGIDAAQFFAQASRFMIVLTDGLQYGIQSSGVATYDGQSISAMTTLTRL